MLNFKSDYECSICNAQKEIVLNRHIDAENFREIVMNDRLNVFQCDVCGYEQKLDFPVCYINNKENFEVWWIPFEEPRVEKEKKIFRRLMGPDSYYGQAPELYNWEEFKETILKFERGELRGNPISFISR